MTPLFFLVEIWAVLVAIYHIGFFLFSWIWGWRVRRAGIEPALAMRRLRARRGYQVFFTLVLLLMTPISLPIQAYRSLHWRVATRRKLAAVSKQPPSGAVEHHPVQNGVMVYADLTLLPHEEQIAFKARLDAGEHPEQVFADIEQRLQQSRIDR